MCFNNSCGGNSWLVILLIIILFGFGGNGCGNSCGSICGGGCGGCSPC